MHPDDQKFRESKQEAVRLEIALQRYFEMDPTEQPDADVAGQYDRYLRSRVYPALALLVRKREHVLLRRLLQTGWVSDAQRLRALAEEPCSDPEIRILLIRKNTDSDASGSHAEGRSTISCVEGRSAGSSVEGQSTDSLMEGRNAGSSAKGQSTDSLMEGRNEGSSAEGQSTGSPVEERSLTAPAADYAADLLRLWGKRLGAEYPALRLALSTLRVESRTMDAAMGTDGITLYYDAEKLGDIAYNSRGYETYLHMITHCIFLHILPPGDVPSELWDLGCDVSSEYLLRKIFKASLTQDKGGPDPFRDFPSWIQLEDAWSVCTYLKKYPSRIPEYTRTFFRDDHRAWKDERAVKKDGERAVDRQMAFAQDDEGGGGRGRRNVPQADRKDEDENPRLKQRLTRLRDIWEGVAEGMAKSAGGPSQHYGLAPGSRREKLELQKEAAFSFRRYLRRFTITREEMQLDMDSFAYIPYYYGMQRYGDMPFIEPLEYTEASRVEELVIAMDTSGSCSLDVIRRFLTETRDLLTTQENFFRRMNVHILQCDSMIQDHAVIHCVEDWNDYLKQLSVHGRGGTDFTPVFTFTEELIQKGELKNLKALLYFTDGDGVYPQQPTPYETAFIFTDYRFLDYPVPDWIVRLCMEHR